MESLEGVNGKTRSAYNLAAGKYHELFQNELDGKAYDRILLDRFTCHFNQSSLVLDAGCGPSGHIGRYLFEKGIPVVGVDISERCVELARHNNPAMQFVCADIANAPFKAEAFDGIIAYYSIIDTPKKYVPLLFQEFHRILKPGGRLLAAVKSGSTEGFLTELLGIQTEIYFSTFIPDEVRRFFEMAAFEIEFLDERSPYEEEIAVKRIFAIGRKK